MVARHIPTFMAIGAILAACKIFNVEEFFEEYIKQDMAERYDYIIVGAGTSGSVIASRLTEDKNRTVLVLEAGEDPYDNQDIDVPIFADRVRGSSFDWGYQTVPQKHSCKAHVDQISMWPSGKGLGGSSNLNYMLYLRGSRHDYDEWANNGATGWSYKEVLPYFIKSEDNHNAEYVRTIFHGYGGRVTIHDINISPVNRIAKAAFDELGLKKRDVNGRNHFGYSNVQATIRGGMRWGTYKAFLRRTFIRPNIYIATGTTVQKILFDGRKATGVVFKKDGKQKIVKANKEVILAAGTVGSAKLLLLSGIGPKNHLSALKIPIVADLPVGENLQDHVFGDGVEYITDKTVSITAARSENFLSSWRYSLFGSGMKMSPRFREAIAYVKTRQQPPHLKYPLIALHVVANVDVYDPKVLNVDEETWREVHSDERHREGFTVYPVLLQPKSTGTVRLKNNDPDEPALINPNYLKEDYDVRLLTEAMHYARRMMNTVAVKNGDFEMSEAKIPACAKYGNWTNAYIECHLRHITMSGYAPVGTCRMGAAGDSMAVVDPVLRVRGVKNLRVADASIIPSAMTGNTYSTQIMIGEKLSDILREKDTVQAIKNYFKHLVSIKHSKIMEDEDDDTSTKPGEKDAGGAGKGKKK